uniref:hypothetical protein n=1 Tax=Sphingobacterium sp. TaxID=341027 RepID=UPI002896B98E
KQKAAAPSAKIKEKGRSGHRGRRKLGTRKNGISANARVGNNNGAAVQTAEDGRPENQQYRIQYCPGQNLFLLIGLVRVYLGFV